MTKLRRVIARLNQMTDITYALLRGALLLTCTMILCALALFIASGGPTLAGFEIYKAARELMALSTITLLLATIGSAIVEELTMEK
ncbi:MAG: hypothetical protein FWD99_03340 [Oscillospiraceae bacterium]|nr:hypothetical protein [Oscillospiraceae bacterium]